jgi:hypothetical protein
VKMKKEQQMEVVINEERLQVKQEGREIELSLICFRIIYSLKNDAKRVTSKSSEIIFKERNLTHMIKVIPHLKNLINKRLNENLKGIEVREDLEFSFLERCQQCYFIYRKEIGHLCKWRRGNADQLEVPDIANKECEPIYLRPITFNAQTVDEELDKFILCRKKFEPQLPTMTLFALEDLRNHPSVVRAYIYILEDMYPFTSDRNGCSIGNT